MKSIFASSFWKAVFAGFALAASSGLIHAQTFIQGQTYYQNFDFGVCANPTNNLTNFSGSCSVASWLYWYGLPGGSTPMTNDVSLDQTGLATSGSLIYSVPFAGASNTQDVIFGTFGNQYGYDESVLADMTVYDRISFWIRADSSTAPRQINGTNVDYGTISAGFFYPYSFEVEGSPTIPLSASNNWVQLTVPINPASAVLKGITGLAFGISALGSTGGVPNYPAEQNSVFYIDSIEVHSDQREYLPILKPPQKAVPGLNCMVSIPGASGQYAREQICTISDPGYSFVGRSGVTYSWDTTVFPLGTGAEGWQQHFFIVNGLIGQNQPAADYNLPDVFWVTVQQADVLTTNKDGSVSDSPGTAFMNFRYKTNEPFGNGMLFNTFSPTDTVNNPHGWPIEPIATLAAPAGAVGTWSVTVAGNTNLTITGPGGVSTNFNIDPAVAALFADPCTLILGAQPNVSTAGGKYSVYGSFSATGCASPINDNLQTDTTLDTSIWSATDAADTNGVYLVPPTAAFWLEQGPPSFVGFTLQTKADLASPGGWIDLPTVLLNSGDGLFKNLIDSNQLPSATQGYFQLIQYQPTQLQVLLAGETNAPGTLTGKTGSPTPVSGAITNGGAYATVTINAVDPTFHIIPGVTDVVSLTSTADPNATEPLNARLVNGTLTEQMIFQTTGSWTVTAADVSETNIVAGTSSSVTVLP